MITPQPANAPTSCVSSTTFTSVDSSMVLTDAGAFLIAPVQGFGIAQSSDNGVTWKGPIGPPSVPAGPLLHPWLWRDPQSNRVFYNVFSCSSGVSKSCSPGSGSCPDGSGAALWISDDDGQTWEPHSVGCGSHDFGQIMTGPAATAVDKQSLVMNQYPNVVYYCATGPKAISGPNRLCYRSLDGGKSFTRTVSDPADNLRYPHDGIVGADGTLYVTHTSPGGLAVAISKDDGDSWKDSIVPGSNFADFTAAYHNDETFLSSSVALDDTGVLYVVWVGSGDLLPYLSVSKDEGGTWSTPLMIGAPGIRVASYPNLVAKEAGHVGVAYYASTQAKGSGDGYLAGDGRPYGAYLMVSTSMLSDTPIMWTTSVNDPAGPVIGSMSYLAGEYIGTPLFAPDGSFWAAFADQGHAMVAHLSAPVVSP